MNFFLNTWVVFRSRWDSCESMKRCKMWIFITGPILSQSFYPSCGAAAPKRSLTSPDAAQINACRVFLALGCDVLRSSVNLSLPVNDCHTSCFWARFKRRHAWVLQPSLIGDLLRLAAENYPPLRASNLSGPFSKQICGGLCALSWQTLQPQSLNIILRSCFPGRAAVCLRSSLKTCLPQETIKLQTLPSQTEMCRRMQQHNTAKLLKHFNIYFSTTV